MQHPDLMWEVGARLSHTLSPWLPNNIRINPAGRVVATIYEDGGKWRWTVDGWAGREDPGKTLEDAQRKADAFLQSKGFLLLEGAWERDPRTDPQEGDLIWRSGSLLMRGVYKREDERVFYEDSNGDCFETSLNSWQAATHGAVIITRGK